jgi:hypothetical protein
MNKWRTVKHFTSWLGLYPYSRKTSGKIIRTRTKKMDNRAFRQAATTLGRSKSALGVFYRRMKAKLGRPKVTEHAQVVVATAHKLARIVHHLLKHQVCCSISETGRRSILGTGNSQFVAQSPQTRCEVGDSFRSS